VAFRNSFRCFRSHFGDNIVEILVVYVCIFALEFRIVVKFTTERRKSVFYDIGFKWVAWSREPSNVKAKLELSINVVLRCENTQTITITKLFQTILDIALIMTNNMRWFCIQNGTQQQYDNVT